MVSKRYEYNKKFREDHKEELVQYQKEYREEHKEEIKEKKARYHQETYPQKMEEIRNDEELLKEHRKQLCVYNKTYRDKVKERFFAMYGSECACCGETCKDFLTLDHVNNDGSAERGAINKGGAHRIRCRAVKEYRPDLYQVMCFNCNLGKSVNGGVCPHKGKRLNT